ncbi:MAG TPA: glycosyltransferase family 2 protein [Roseiflexaceae bacterium]|nr:glycosyltransferase family 2 protein [Roseiflexaceae bacterium]
MKLIVQIPAYNEGATIGEVIDHIPRRIPGVSTVEVLIIDDGCTDDTVAVALAHGADHIVRHVGNKGLARAYQTGIDAGLRLGADIIVNTDADHQYPGAEIPRLIQPILDGRAEIVVGNRQIHTIDDFSTFKKLLQYLGSGVVRWASGTDIPDTVSGFRALSREAALRTFVTSDFSYTVENLIQAGKKRLTLATVPIRTNPTRRPSKLARSNWQFIKRQAAIIVRTYATYEPLKTFSYIAAPFLILGTLFLARAFYVFLARRLITDYVASNDQALVGGSVLFIVGFVILLVGLLADRIGGVRRVEEEVLYRLRKQEIEDEAWRRTVSARLSHLERNVDPEGKEEVGSRK